MPMRPLTYLLALAGGLCVFARPAMAQPASMDDVYERYSVIREETLSAAAECVAIQGDGNGSNVQFVSATLECKTAGCRVLAYIDDSTGSTTTAVTPTAMGKNREASTITAYRDANGSGGTKIADFPVTAGVPYPLDVRGLTIPKNGATTRGLRVCTSTVSSDIVLSIVWIEKQ